MKKIKIILIPIAILLMATSCMTTRTNVGSYKEKLGTEYTYAKGKQIWLLWGLLPVGITNVETPRDGTCKVVTKYNITDVIITVVTLGFVKTYTIKIKDKKPLNDH